MAYPISKWIYFPVFGLLIKKIKGMDNIPDKNSFIIVSNHEHLIDPLYIIYPILKRLNKKVHFLSTGSWWFFGDTICRQWAGCIPLFESNAYEEMKNYVKEGRILGLFPEGRLKAGARQPKTGAVRLAIETDTPILPIGIKSSYILFNSTINIGKLKYMKKGKDIKKQTLDLMDYVYRLRIK